MSPNKVLPPYHAFGIALAAYLLFTVGDALGKWLQAGYSAAQILFTVNVVGLVFMLLLATALRGRDALKSDKWKLHAIRACFMAGSTMLVMVALKNLPLAEFYGIVFLNPIWVALISRMVLKQDIPPSRWCAIALGFAGVLIIAGPQFANLNLGAVAAIGASLCSASAALMARHIGGHEAPTNFTLAAHIVLAAANGGLMLAIGDFKMPGTHDLALMLGYGIVVSLAMSGIATVFARSHVVSQVAPLQYTQMIWGVLIGWLVFDQPATPRIYLGALLVVGAGIYILQSLRRGRLMNR